MRNTSTHLLCVTCPRYNLSTYILLTVNEKYQNTLSAWHAISITGIHTYYKYWMRNTSTHSLCHIPQVQLEYLHTFNSEWKIPEHTLCMTHHKHNWNTYILLILNEKYQYTLTLCVTCPRYNWSTYILLTVNEKYQNTLSAWHTISITGIHTYY